MTSSINFNNSYYLEICPGSEECSRSIASAVMIRTDQKDDDAWGYLVYQDTVDHRQRIVALAQTPASATEKSIDCISTSGERFCFAYIDYDLWMSKVRHYAHIPQYVSDKLTTTEAVQAFFKI